MSIYVNRNLPSRSRHLLKWHFAQLSYSRGHASVTKDCSRLKCTDWVAIDRVQTELNLVPGTPLARQQDLEGVDPTEIPTPCWEALRLPSFSLPDLRFHEVSGPKMSTCRDNTWGSVKVETSELRIWWWIEPPGSRMRDVFCFFPGIHLQTIAIQQSSALGMISCYPMCCLRMWVVHELVWPRQCSQTGVPFDLYPSWFSPAVWIQTRCMVWGPDAASEGKLSHSGRCSKVKLWFPMFVDKQHETHIVTLCIHIYIYVYICI